MPLWVSCFRFLQSPHCGLGVAPNSKVTVEQLIAFKPTNLLEGSIHLIAAGTEHSISLCTGQKVMYVLERTLAERMDASRLPAARF
jgi:hypothetical protein